MVDQSVSTFWGEESQDGFANTRAMEWCYHADVGVHTNRIRTFNFFYIDRGVVVQQDQMNCFASSMGEVLEVRTCHHVKVCILDEATAEF